MNRAYSLFTIKSIDEEQRVIRGMATTPSTDRVGDIIEPLGVKVAKSIPLFLYHDSRETVGRAFLEKPQKDGVPFEARIPKVSEAGRLKDRVDEAWQMLKYRLITGVSVGFNVLNDAYEVMKDGGYRFLETEILELSLVPIPANAEATITSIKSIDQAQLAASGRALSASPGVSGTSKGIAHSPNRNPKGNQMKTLQEQLNELKTARTEKAARMTELIEVTKAENRATTNDEATEFDGLESEIKTLDDQIRVKTVEAMNASAARPAAGDGSASASASRGGMSYVKTQDPDDKFKGQAYTRFLMAKALAYMQAKDGNFVSPAEIAQHRWGKSHPKLVQYIKAAVAGGGAGSGEWGAELAQSDTRYTGDFISYLYGMTVFDKLALREVPARVHIKGQDGASTGYWVGESKAIPATTSDASSVELTPLKVAALAVCSKELILDSSPSAEMWIRDSIAQASAQRVDTTFLGAGAASAGVSPAGLLNGLSGGVPSGTDAAAVRADVMTLYSGFLAAKNAGGLTMVMTPSLAKALSLLVNALGQPEFDGLNANGGTLWGDPVVTGDNVTGGHLILLKPSDIWKIGDSGLDVSMTDTATIEMNDAPAGASDTPVAMASHTVSLWQTESVGFKVVRRINYQKRRSGAVAFMDNCEYGGVVS